MEFNCFKCGTADLIELAYPRGKPDNSPAQCTCCQGRPWHNQFPREKSGNSYPTAGSSTPGIGLG